MAEKLSPHTSTHYRELARRSHQRRAVLDGESVELLRRHMASCPEADPTRSAAWAKLWAKLLAPAERAASSGEEVGDDR